MSERDVESELWLRLKRLEKLTLATATYVNARTLAIGPRTTRHTQTHSGTDDEEYMALERILAGGPASPAHSATASNDAESQRSASPAGTFSEKQAAQQSLCERAAQVCRRHTTLPPQTSTLVTHALSPQGYEGWKSLTINRSKTTTAIDALLQAEPLCSELLEADQLKEQGMDPTAALACKLKVIETANWDDVRSTCGDIDELLALADVLDSAPALASLCDLCDASAAAHGQAAQRKAQAEAVHAKAVALWNAVHQQAALAQKAQLAWGLLLTSWEQRVEAGLRRKGIEPVS